MAGNKVEMLRGNKIESKPIEWLCPSVLGERFPVGMIALVSGRPGQGKSSLTSYLTAEVTRQGHSVIHSNQEDAIREILVPRLLAAGADMKRVFLPETPMMIPRELDQLERLIKQVRAKLVVMDAAAQHLNVSIYNDQEVRKALTPLAKVLERTGCACVMISHTKKGRYADPLEAIGGASGGLVGASRVVYIFGADPKDPDQRVLAPAKSNIGPVDTATEFSCEVVGWKVNRQRGGPITLKVFRLKPVTHHSATTAAAVTSFVGGKGKAGEDPTDPTRLAMAEEWLTGLLKDGPMKATDIEAEAAKVKVSWGTVRRAQATLEIAKKRTGYGANGFWEWDLPDGHPLKKSRPPAPAPAPDAVKGNGKAKRKDVDAAFAAIVQGIGGGG